MSCLAPEDPCHLADEAFCIQKALLTLGHLAALSLPSIIMRAYVGDHVGTMGSNALALGGRIESEKERDRSNS